MVLMNNFDFAASHVCDIIKLEVSIEDNKTLYCERTGFCFDLVIQSDIWLITNT